MQLLNLETVDKFEQLSLVNKHIWRNPLSAFALRMRGACYHTSVLPGMIGLPAYSSARMHPALQRSTETP
jgi:hypothetical protein